MKTASKPFTRLARRVGVLAALACVAAGGAISANFAVKPVVIDQGGGRAGSSSYDIVASIGGPVIATSSSTNYTLNANVRIDAGPITPPTPEEPDKPFVSFTGGGCAPSGTPAPRGQAPLAFGMLVFFAALSSRVTVHRVSDGSERGRASATATG